MTTSPGIDLDISARLCASLDGMTAALAADASHRRQLAAGVDYIPDLIVAAAALPFAQAENTGPKAGYAWAVQAVRVSALGGTSDYVQVFRGRDLTAAQGNLPALYTFSTPSAASPYYAAPWHPGRTGLVLRGGDGLVLGGSVTGIGTSSPLLLAIDVIQVTLAKLPYFLL